MVTIVKVNKQTSGWSWWRQGWWQSCHRWLWFGRIAITKGNGLMCTHADSYQKIPLTAKKIVHEAYWQFDNFAHLILLDCFLKNYVEKKFWSDFLYSTKHTICTFHCTFHQWFGCSSITSYALKYETRKCTLSENDILWLVLIMFHVQYSHDSL